MNMLAKMRLGKRLAVGFGYAECVDCNDRLVGWWGLYDSESAGQNLQRRFRRTAGSNPCNWISTTLHFILSSFLEQKTRQHSSSIYQESMRSGLPIRKNWQKCRQTREAGGVETLDQKSRPHWRLRARRQQSSDLILR